MNFSTITDKRGRNRLVIEDAVLYRSNFSGTEQRDINTGRVLNGEGNKNFCIELPDEEAEKLADEGWNIKIRAPREEGEKPIYYLKVNVSYRFYEPDIRTYVNGVETFIHEDTVHLIDDMDIISMDVIINPASEEGRNPFLYELRLVVSPRPFDAKYAAMQHPEE